MGSSAGSAGHADRFTSIRSPSNHVHNLSNDLANQEAMFGEQASYSANQSRNCYMYIFLPGYRVRRSPEGNRVTYAKACGNSGQDCS